MNQTESTLSLPNQTAPAHVDDPVDLPQLGEPVRRVKPAPVLDMDRAEPTCGIGWTEHDSVDGSGEGNADQDNAEPSMPVASRGGHSSFQRGGLTYVRRDPKIRTTTRKSVRPPPMSMC